MDIRELQHFMEVVNQKVSRKQQLRFTCLSQH